MITKWEFFLVSISMLAGILVSTIVVNVRATINHDQIDQAAVARVLCDAARMRITSDLREARAGKLVAVSSFGGDSVGNGNVVIRLCTKDQFDVAELVARTGQCTTSECWVRELETTLANFRWAVAP